MDGFTRRRFLASATALAASAPMLRAASDAAAAPEALRAIYENADGTATDAVWCRRVYLDLAGRIPTAAEARAFASDADAEKRTRLVDRLLASEDFADFWSMRYCDILRVKSEFPINLWPNAVYVYHRRIRRSLATDESWLAFAEAVLSTAGSDFRDAEVNFLRASANRSAQGLSEAASLTFLGEASAAYAECFAGVGFKSTREWKEEIVCFAPTGPRPADFAARLKGDLEERFASAHASRVWNWLFCAPPDADATRTLAALFRQGGYRLKPFLRHLVLAPAYARGSVTGGFPVRRLDAEVLEDALCALTGLKRAYQSIAPEPFTFLPPERKSVLIEDGSISSAFLILFGRPARDAGTPDERRNDVTAKQRLYLFNSGRLYHALTRSINQGDLRDRPFREKVEELYWRYLGRAPASAERDLLQTRFAALRKAPGPVRGRFAADVAWCLINTREFLFRI